MDKQKPTVIVSAADYTDPYPIPVNDENFNLYLSITNPFVISFVDPSIFNVNAVQRKIIYNENNELEFSEKVKIDTCNNYYISSFKISNDTWITPSTFYCITMLNSFLFFLLTLVSHTFYCFY